MGELGVMSGCWAGVCWEGCGSGEGCSFGEEEEEARGRALRKIQFLEYD